MESLQERHLSDDAFFDALEQEIRQPRKWSTIHSHMLIMHTADPRHQLSNVALIPLPASPLELEDDAQDQPQIFISIPEELIAPHRRPITHMTRDPSLQSHIKRSVTVSTVQVVDMPKAVIAPSPSVMSIEDTLNAHLNASATMTASSDAVETSATSDTVETTTTKQQPVASVVSEPVLKNLKRELTRMVPTAVARKKIKKVTSIKVSESNINAVALVNASPQATDLQDLDIDNMDEEELERMYNSMDTATVVVKGLL